MKRYLIPFLFALAATACNRTQLSDVPADARRVDLVCRMDSQINTRAGETYSDYPNNSSVGLFICDHSDADPNPFIQHAPGYKNILASKENDKWTYTYGGYSGSLPNLYIRVKKDEQTDEPILTDVFAYAPHRTDSSLDLHNISFDVTNGNEYQKDPRWCVENASPTENKMIDAAEVDEFGNKIQTVEVHLTFKHALAQIACQVTIRNTQYLHPDGDGKAAWPNIDMYLDKVNADAHMHSAGYMDAFDGSLHSLNDVSSIRLSSIGFYNTNTATQTATTQFVPTQDGEDYADGDYQFRFIVGDLTSPVRFPILREHLRHGTSDVYGFQPGYRYTFHFIIDNYVHFSGLTIGTWEDVDTPLYEIEI